MIITEKQISELTYGLAFWLKRWGRDPVAYVIEHLGEVPTYHQADILRKLVKHHFVAIRSGHGIGKSKLSGWAVNWYLDTQAKPGGLTRVPITGAGGKQLESTMWAEVNSANKKKWPFIGKRYAVSSEQMVMLEDPKGCFAVLRTARTDNPDALQGFHDCFFVIDEGSGVSDAVFEVCRGAMGDPGSFGLMLGNPTKLSGYFFNVFNNTKTVWHTMHFSSLDSLAEETYSYWYCDPLGNMIEIKHQGRQTRAWAEDMKEEYGENSNAYKIRVLGEFALGEGDLVIEPDWLKNIWINPERDDNKKRLKIMGVDPARSGVDNTAVVIRQGDDILYAAEWNGADLVQSRKRIEIIQSEWRCDAIGVDILGVGAGLHDELRALGFPVFSVDVNTSPPEPNKGKCRILRDWLWWKSREFFRTHTVRFAGDDKNPTWMKLKKELTSPLYSVKTLKLVVEGKDDLKKRGVVSPNLADALNNTFMRDSAWEKPDMVISENRRKKKKIRRSFMSC